jgi:RND superfamily putative drug exporter
VRPSRSDISIERTSGPELSLIPLFIGVVLALSLLLLMVVFRSLLVPLKAVVMNLLSIGAAYGVVTAIFQWGWLGSVLNIATAWRPPRG